MDFDRMSKAVPPVYASFAFGQLARHTLRQRYGLDVPSYDAARLDLPRARRRMLHLRRGAGGTSASLGMQLEPASVVVCDAQKEAYDASDSSGSGSTAVFEPALSTGVTELLVREVDCSYAGCCDQAICGDDAFGHLSALRPTARLDLGTLRVDAFVGHHTFISVSTISR